MWVYGVKRREESSSLGLVQNLNSRVCPLGFGKREKDERRASPLHTSCISSSPLKVLLQLLKIFQRFEERIQISQEESHHAN